jgi:hypothetical protein
MLVTFTPSTHIVLITPAVLCLLLLLLLQVG